MLYVINRVIPESIVAKLPPPLEDYFFVEFGSYSSPRLARVQYEGRGMEGTPRMGILIGEARNWQRDSDGIQVWVQFGAVPY